MTFKKAVWIFGVFALFTIASLGASAQCGIGPFQGKLKPQAFLGDNPSGSLLLVSEHEDYDDGDGIVGLWRITVLSKGNSGNPFPFNPPDDAILDQGFAQWHSDGTEIMNSNRKPATGSFCLGVWKRVGRSEYKLNHFALAFDDGIHLGYGNIREDVVLSHDGQSFKGHFSLALFDAEGHAGPVLNGEITGVRVKVNTTLGDIL